MVIRYSKMVNNKKAMSAIVSIMMLVLIVLAGTAIIWKILSKTVDEGLEESKSCYDLIGKVVVNSEYTCYDRAENEMHVSIGVGDIDIDGLLIAITDENSSVSFELTNEITNIPGLLNYTRSDDVKAPGKNSGVTYVATNIVEIPLSIEIAPKLNNHLCEGDTFTGIEFCSTG